VILATKEFAKSCGDEEAALERLLVHIDYVQLGLVFKP